MLPADLGIESFAGFLRDNIAPISTSADSIIYHYRKRAVNFYNCETKMVFSRQGMLDFARTGELADQFYACRPFTKEERLACLRYLLQRMRQTGVTILFSQDEPSRNFSFEAYSRFGTLIYPSRTSYNVENDAYRELILPGETYAALFCQFVEEVVIPGYCYTAAESSQLMNCLISMIDAS